VGYQCIDCVQAGRRRQRDEGKRYHSAGFGARTVAGARVAERPVITPVLIALNVLVYLVTAVQARSPMDNELSPLFLDGMLWSPSIAFEGEWWRLLTSGFLHFGPIHVAVNMFSLWILGRDVELLLGKARFTAVYFVSMLGGSVAVFAFDDPGIRTAGASGAIYGLLGAILVAVLRLRLNPTQAVGIIVLNLIISVSLPGISLLGHLGGLVVGALATAAMVYAPAKGRVAWQGGALVVLLAALVVLFLWRDAELGRQVCGLVGGRVACVDR
jgi:membrane associated rhomboid family serine protease